MSLRWLGASFAAVALLGVLSACSATDTTSSSASPSSSSTSAAEDSTACPSSAVAPGQEGADATEGEGAPEGAPEGEGEMPELVGATTIAPSDNSTSTILEGTGPSIECGQVDLTTETDVQYDETDDGRALRFDIQVPETDGTKPLVVYLTGGGFQSDNKSGNLDQRTYVAEQGFVVASIEYSTISDGATYQDTVADVKSAIRYLRAHASEYSIDPDQVAVWGQSAGGYLAAMTGATNGLEEFEGTGNPGQDSTVQAVVDEFGPSNFAELAADYDTAMQDAMYAPGSFLAQYSIGTDTTESVLDNPDAVAAADPSTYVTSSGPAYAFYHGTADNLVSPSQTLLVHDAVQAAGGDSTRYVVQDGGHGDLSVLDDPTAATQWDSQEVVGTIVSFLQENLS
ncbi:prolyl oligopeptidase family serine peptidase [Promicromonospora sp. Populi]|uniref:prolyl oligopeptidase family serine peptidase n=1 Tax=Promicromonospora sp. Populi TaxID=3239420 RepID=UPI0034E26DD4